MKIKIAQLISISFVISLLTSVIPAQAVLPNWREKIDPWVLTQTENGPAEFLVYLDQQADLSLASQIQIKAQKGAFVYKQLTTIAQRTQMPILTLLRSRLVPHRSYWIANMLWVEGDQNLLQLLAQRSDVAHIYANPKVRFAPPFNAQTTPSKSLYTDNAESAIEWNIQQVGAPNVWQVGFSGQGVIIGGQDTGYKWDHPALISQYRGWDGKAADHNYSWHDAIHEDGSNCPPDSIEPCDDYGHGTHTMGTMVGDDGFENKIGMAPGARWIGCRNMLDGVGSPATYSECYQWFLAPTDLNGENPRPDLAPDVINNSWSCPPAEGCTDPLVLLSVVENLRAAGILTVHSAGNNGSNCSTVNTPAAIYEASFTVGATDSADQIASFSSRGPVNIDGSGRLKPDVVAPGVGVRSSTLKDGYSSLTGTSMAGPHVAGLVALLISANPDLRGQVDAIESVIQQTSLRLAPTQICGGIPGTQTPNNITGHGRIDAWRAYKFAVAEVTYLPMLQMQLISP